MKKLLVLLLFVTSFSYGQSLKELYLEQMKSLWEVNLTKEIPKQIDSIYRNLWGDAYRDTLMNREKKSVTIKASRFDKILDALDISLSSVDSLALIQQHTFAINDPELFIFKGAVITQDRTVGFQYNVQKEAEGIQKKSYFNTSRDSVYDLAKRIIKNSVLQGKSHVLDSLAKIESELLNTEFKEFTPEVEFEILVYNRTKKQKLRCIYLHELFAYISLEGLKRQQKKE